MKSNFKILIIGIVQLMFISCHIMDDSKQESYITNQSLEIELGGAEGYIIVFISLLDETNNERIWIDDLDSLYHYRIVTMNDTIIGNYNSFRIPYPDSGNIQFEFINSDDQVLFKSVTKPCNDMNGKFHYQDSTLMFGWSGCERDSVNINMEFKCWDNAGKIIGFNIDTLVMNNDEATLQFASSIRKAGRRFSEIDSCEMKGKVLRDIDYNSYETRYEKSSIMWSDGINYEYMLPIRDGMMSY